MSPVLHLGEVALAYPGDAQTKLFVLLGSPVAHSRSPAMHSAALRAIGWNAAYVACQVEPAQLAECCKGLRVHAERGSVAGANVTVPHKRAVASWLTRLDPIAALAGAVNTIVVRRDATAGSVWLEGHDTDVAGLVAALAEHAVPLAGARVVVLGAGGMARAAVAAALREGAAEIRICSRDPWRAQEMLDEVAGRWHGRVPPLACATFAAGAGRFLADADVLVQATSLGLDPADPSPVDLAAAAPGLFVFDAVYGPEATACVRRARARGLRTGDGLALLLHQGAAAFALWTGLPAPLAVMRSALES